MPTRTVVFLAYDSVQLIDVAGPTEVFAAATALGNGDEYRTLLASIDGRQVRTSAGLRVGADLAFAAEGSEIDTFIVPGSPARETAMGCPGVLDAIAAGVQRSRRVAAVCSGAFLLAAAGLLDGRRATTHWKLLDELEARFPAVAVERDALVVADAPIFTSAGASAGIDLALALVEADHGPDLARSVARHLVVFMQRPGGQSQFSVRLGPRAPLRPPLGELVDSIAEDPAGDHRRGALSGRAGFSERHLARLFARDLGTTPAQYVERTRVEAARIQLETTDAPLEIVARRSGLGSAETLRRTFSREVGVTPHAYRQRFRTTGIGRRRG